MNAPQQRGGQAADVAWLLSDEALEIGRRAVEDELVELRDARIGQLRNNGLVVKERDGSPSDIIRLGPEDALRIGLRAMLTSAPPAPSVGGWISVEDELPVLTEENEDDGVPVWTWDGQFVTEDEYLPEYEQPAGPAVGGWLRVGESFGQDRLGRVTHWMPRVAPQPPKEKP